MVTICLVDHLYLLGVVIVPVGHIVDVQPVVLQVQPGVRPTTPYLLRKFCQKYFILNNKSATEFFNRTDKDSFHGAKGYKSLKVIK